MTLRRFALSAILFISFTYAIAGSNPNSPLVDTHWLASNLDHVVILDVRTSKKNFISKPSFHLNKKSGKQVLSQVGGHIPGAQLILYKHVRGDRKIDGRTIKHMVVSSEQFETLLQQAGVNQNSHIVIATNAESAFDLTMASRMYWQVKYFGHDNVSILDGGTAQWLVDGRDISTSSEKPKPGNWQAQQVKDTIFASSDDVHLASNNDDIQIVDVRPLGQYLGAFKSGKAKSKGHIPTAKVFPVDLLASRSTPVKFSSAGELNQLSNALGIDAQKAVITYCNSGHMASGSWFAFHEILGNKNVRLYDGSMHQWTHEDRPVISMKLE